jgi:hypothetical protein
MKGVTYYFDEKGEPTAVLIDLKKNPEIWEDFQDIMFLEKRRQEPVESASAVKANIHKKRGQKQKLQANGRPK